MSATALHYLSRLEEHPLEQLLTAWRAEQPKMGVLALLPEAERDAVPRLQAACARLGVPVVGALFPALVERNEFRTQGAWLLRLDEMPYVGLYPNLPREPEQIQAAMDALAADIIPHVGDEPEVTLLLLFD